MIVPSSISYPKASNIKSVFLKVTLTKSSFEDETSSGCSNLRWICIFWAVYESTCQSNFFAYVSSKSELSTSSTASIFSDLSSCYCKSLLSSSLSKTLSISGLISFEKSIVTMPDIEISSIWAIVFSKSWPSHSCFNPIFTSEAAF